jgi:hypothetical protein
MHEICCDYMYKSVALSSTFTSPISTKVNGELWHNRLPHECMIYDFCMVILNLMNTNTVETNAK